MASIPTKTMRATLKTVYSGKRWAAKVDKMTDAQVVAIYRNLQQQNKV
jgi:hypothetical protein